MIGPSDPFDIPARRTDPATSHAAARQFIASGKRDSQHARILRAMLRGYDGFTAAEIEHALRIKAHKRLPELERQGLVHRGIGRKCGVSGMLATTWWLT